MHLPQFSLFRLSPLFSGRLPEVFNDQEVHLIWGQIVSGVIVQLVLQWSKAQVSLQQDFFLTFGYRAKNLKKLYIYFFFHSFLFFFYLFERETKRESVRECTSGRDKETPH